MLWEHRQRNNSSLLELCSLELSSRVLNILEVELLGPCSLWGGLRNVENVTGHFGGQFRYCCSHPSPESSIVYSTRFVIKLSFGSDVRRKRFTSAACLACSTTSCRPLPSQASKGFEAQDVVHNDPLPYTLAQESKLPKSQLLNRFVKRMWRLQSLATRMPCQGLRRGSAKIMLLWGSRVQ